VDGQSELADSISEIIDRRDAATAGSAVGEELARRMLDRGAAELVGNG